MTDRDFDRLVKAVPAILRAGFRCDRRFVNSDGQVTELTFLRHGARFEFFRMFPADGRLRYYMYSIKLKEITQVEAYVPEQETVPFSFLDRTWLKPEDHDLELEDGLRFLEGPGSVVVIPRYPRPRSPPPITLPPLRLAQWHSGFDRELIQAFVGQLRYRYGSPFPW